MEVSRRGGDDDECGKWDGFWRESPFQRADSFAGIGPLGLFGTLEATTFERAVRTARAHQERVRATMRDDMI